MQNITVSEIKQALEYGQRNGYILFPQIRIKENIKQAQQNNITSKMIKDINNYAESIKRKQAIQLPFKMFIDFSISGNRLNYEKKYFESKKELHSLLIAEVIEDKGRFIEAIQERLWLWCNEYSWELPAHVPLTPNDIEDMQIEADRVVALFSAETAFYFAEILSILKDKLHPLLVYRLEKEIDKRVIISYENKKYWWEDTPMNWAAVCGGATGCTAIYRIEDTERLAKILYRVINTMNSYLAGFDKDGVTTEGLSYWQYGFSFYIYFAQLLKERTCGKIDLFRKDKKIIKIATLPTYLQFPSGHMINFSDASGDKWEGEYGILSILSEIFNIDNYMFLNKVDIFKDHTSKWALMARNIFWSLTPNNKNTIKTKVGSFCFEESQWFIDRRIDSQGRFSAFVAKGGHNDEPHNHNDLGNFILHYDGENIFCDLGAPEYVRDFFGDKRYEFLNASSKGHSVPIINGNYQQAGKEYCSSLVSTETNDYTLRKLGFTKSLDLTKAYNVEELLKYYRTFDWDGENLELQLRDKFKFKKEKNNIEEVLITHLDTIKVKSGELKLTTENADVYIFFDSDAECNIREEEYKDHFSNNRKVNRICINYPNVKKEKIITIVIKIIPKNHELSNKV